MRKFNAIIESTTPPVDTNVLWIKDKHAYHFSKGLWIPIGENDTDIELLTRTVEEHIADDMPTDILLQVGNSDDVKESNLAALGAEELIAHAKVIGGYGYGSVYWVPSSGGIVSVVNPAGSTIWYNVTIEGAMSMITESYDLYKYYSEYFSNYTSGNSAMANEAFIKAVLKKLFDKKGGTKALRPSNPELGQTFYQTDTGLIIWNGSTWVDCMDNMPID